MARKKNERGSKAAAIRKLLERNPQLRTVEVVNRLSAKGITVSASQVSGVRNRLKEEPLKDWSGLKGLDTEGQPLELGELVCNSQNRNPNGFELYNDLRKVAELVRDIGFDRATEALKFAKELDGIFGETP